MKLLVDMNLSPKWVETLTQAGFTAVHWSSIGKPDASDSEIFGYAASGGFIILTHDLDFGTLLVHSKAHHPSVIQARIQDVTPEALSSWSYQHSDNLQNNWRQVHL